VDSETKDPGSNPTRAEVFRENMALLFCLIDLLCIVCMLKRNIKARAQNRF
jgi:hypothetical protein